MLHRMFDVDAKQSNDESGLVRRRWGSNASAESCDSFHRPPRRTHNSIRSENGAKERGYFVDATAVKERVRENLIKPKYNVWDSYKDEGVWQAVAKSSFFEQVTLGVIAVNAVWIAIDTDLNHAAVLVNAHPVFQVAENAFCVFFTMELFIRFMSFQRFRYALRDFWFVFDSALVITMVLETWVMTIVVLASTPAGSSGGGGGMGNASILRIARLLRLSRMARMARLLRAMPELMIMIKGMMAAMRSVFFTLCLLVIIMYVFAIAFTQLTTETDVGDRYFKSVPSSMFTLLMYGTLLDDIGNLTRELGREAMPIAGLFLVFVLLAALTVMNMLIGVLCEVVSVVAAIEKEEMLVNYVNEKLQKVMALLDADGDETISKTEFLQILENVDAARCLQDVGVDVIGLVDFADFIFADDHVVGAYQFPDEEAQISFAKFTEVVLQLRGTNNATVKDIVDLRKFVRNAMIETNEQLGKLLDQVKGGGRRGGTRGRRTDCISEVTKSNSLGIYSSSVSEIARSETVQKHADASRLMTESFSFARPLSESKDGNSRQESTVCNDAIPVDANLKANGQDYKEFACTSIDVVAAGGVSPSSPPVSDPVDLLRQQRHDTAHRSSDDFDSDRASPRPVLHGQWYPVESSDQRFHNVQISNCSKQVSAPSYHDLSGLGPVPLTGVQASALGGNKATEGVAHFPSALQPVSQLIRGPLDMSQQKLEAGERQKWESTL